MKLDRNQNQNSAGKYALLKMRRVLEIKKAGENAPWGSTENDLALNVDNAINLLRESRCLHFGDEGRGEQFFVMKYKDKFTAPALMAYAKAVENAAVSSQAGAGGDSIMEYANEIEREAVAASECGYRIPD